MDCLLSFLALSHKKNPRIFACKNRRILTPKRESEHVHAPVTAGARQIFLGYRFFLIFIEKFYLTDCDFRFINYVPFFIKSHIFY